MKTPSSRSTPGFSLVEIVLAIGVASFALVSILGLLQVAMNSDNSASRDTTLAAMSNHVLNELRAVPFDSLWAADPETARDSAPSTATPVASTYFFTNEGAPVGSTASSGFEVVYKCVVTKTPDVVSKNADTGLYNQLKLQLEFSWPVNGGSTTNKEGSQALYASIARR